MARYGCGSFNRGALKLIQTDFIAIARAIAIEANSIGKQCARQVVIGNNGQQRRRTNRPANTRPHLRRSILDRSNG